MTLREWLNRGEEQLSAGPHPERARRDVEALLLHLLGKSRAWLMAHADEDFAGCAAIGYAGLLDRRQKGEPLQYITGEAEFYGLPFQVTRDVLIPRPETEHLVERILALAALFPKPHILDIGTGSGAIAIALAHHLPQAHITAIDLSDPALTLARENATRNSVSLRFLQGDLLAPIAAEVFDIIVSNPPYVPAAERDTLSVEVRDHEPALALFGGDDGLAIYRRLIPAAFAALAPGGWLALEIGFGQADSVHALLRAAGFSNAQSTPDLQGIPRVVSARRQ